MAPADRPVPGGNAGPTALGSVAMKAFGLSSSGYRYAASVAAGLLFTMVLTLPRLERVARASSEVVLAVVVARGSAVQNVRLAQLKRAFINEADSDVSGQRYVPFNHSPRTTDRMAFDKIVLGMSADEVGQFWIERRIRGFAGPPRSVDSVSVLLRLVARLPGGMAYARPAQLTSEVRAVRVNGKLPGDANYPLTFSQ